jgi:hypothetical protein
MRDGRYVTNHNLASTSGSWRINGVGDFDEDGDADVLWRHSDGQVVTWEMEGGAYVTNRNIGSAPTSWQTASETLTATATAIFCGATATARR